MIERIKMDEYTVVIGGLEHTMLLSKEDADRLSGIAVKQVKVQNKDRAPRNKSSE